MGYASAVVFYLPYLLIGGQLLFMAWSAGHGSTLSAKLTRGVEIGLGLSLLGWPFFQHPVNLF